MPTYPGRAWVHDLPEKLAAASHAGYTGVEMFWEDLVYAARQFVSDKEANDLTSLAKNEGAMLQASHYARDLCDQNHLKIIVLQPFMNYEGQLDDEKHRQSIAQLKLFFKVVKVLGTDLIQVSTQVGCRSHILPTWLSCSTPGSLLQKVQPAMSAR